MVYRIYYRGKVKYTSPVKNRQELMALRNSKENLETLAKARQGDQGAKAGLLQLAYNLGYTEDVLAGCESQGSFFVHDVDCYDPEKSESTKELILSKKDEIGLMMLEKSPSGGWHLVCRRVPHTTILENQVRVATILRIEMDTNVKNLNRIVFSTSGSEEDLPYLDDGLFEEPMTKEECAEEYRLLKKREQEGREAVPKGAKKANKHYRPWEDGVQGDTQSDTQGAGTPCTSAQKSQSPCVTEADARTRYVFEACMKECELEPEVLIVEGARHEAVKSILSVGATQLLTKAEFLGVLSEMMPGNWQDRNIQQLVDDFYTKYHDPSQKMTQFQRQVFAKSRKIGTQESQAASLDDAGQQPQPGAGQSELSKLFASKLPPELPAVLPRLVKTVTQNTPKKYKATVAQACFPSVATYPQKLGFVYIDNQVRELRINCLTIAETGSGKDSCLKGPIKHIIADMKELDEENRKRLKKFNEEYNSKAGNKQKPQRPDDLVIQTIKANITYAALVQRMDEAQSAPLYVKLNVLEQWDKIEGVSGRKNQFTTLKLCDDEENDFGADRASTQSVTGSGSLHLNWNGNTTLPKAYRYFRFVLTDGPISRLCLATIPEEEIGADISVFGNYDEAYDEALKPYIDNLKAATGIIDCQQAKKLARQCAEFARLSQDRVFDNLSHRALVGAFRKACLLYAANGMRWERAIESFCRWSLFYDLYLKMKFWGDQIRHADEDTLTSKRGPQSLLDLLPDEFTLEDAKRVRQRQGLSNEGHHPIKMIRTWINRSYVIQNTEYSFKKAHK